MAWWTWGALRAVLVRQIPVNLVDVSTAGCTLDAGTPFESGTVGLLETGEDSNGCREAVRICRAVERQGTALRYRVATEFLVLDAPGIASLREQAARLELPLLGELPGGTGRKSGGARRNPGSEFADRRTER